MGTAMTDPGGAGDPAGRGTAAGAGQTMTHPLHGAAGREPAF
jgi:hypothetical protein